MLKPSQVSDQEFEQLETQFQDLEVKKLYHPDPSSSAKDWYSKPSPPDLRYEERNVGNQFSVASGRLYEWNIDGLSEQEIRWFGWAARIRVVKPFYL